MENKVASGKLMRNVGVEASRDFAFSFRHVFVLVALFAKFQVLWFQTCNCFSLSLRIQGRTAWNLENSQNEKKITNQNI